MTTHAQRRTVSPRSALGVVSRAASRWEGTPIPPCCRGPRSEDRGQKTPEGKNDVSAGSEPRRREWTGVRGNGLAVWRPVPRVRTAKPATRRAATLKCHAHTHPRPPRRRGRDRDVCPAPQPPPTGHRHASMSQPLRVAGIAGTQQHRDRPGSCAWAQPPGPAGAWPRGPECLLGAAATLRASGEPTPGTIATSRPPREPSPPRDATPLLISTIAVDGKRFSLDYGTFIRVRRAFSPTSTTRSTGRTSAGGRAAPNPGR